MNIYQKKINLYYIFFLMNFLSACSSIIVDTTPKKSIISYDVSIGFIYITKNKPIQIINMTTEYNKPKENEEVIHITGEGFHPNYSLVSYEDYCPATEDLLKIFKDDKESYTGHFSRLKFDYNQFCSSVFTVQSKKYIIRDVLTNIGLIIGTSGENLISGMTLYSRKFNYSNFELFIKKRTLEEYTTSMLEIMRLVNKNNYMISKVCTKTILTNLSIKECPNYINFYRNLEFTPNNYKQVLKNVKIAIIRKFQEDQILLKQQL